MIVTRAPRIRRKLTYIGRPLLYLVLWDCLIVFGYKILHLGWAGSRAIPLALYGSAIGIIVAFRNSSAYGRWWEARTLWGSVVNNSRSLAREAVTLLGPAEDHAAAALRGRLIHLQIGFVHALRMQLRGLDPLPEVRRVLTLEDLPEAEWTALESQKNVALAIQQRMADLLAKAHGRGWIDTIDWQAMDRNLDDLMDSQGGLERIKNTPFPMQFGYFPTLFIQIYCLLLPVGMVEGLGWFTPLGSTLVGFMFLALDRIGRDLQDPFNNQIYDVPMTAICTTIEINLRQMLGEVQLPAPVEPVEGVLW